LVGAARGWSGGSPAGRGGKAPGGEGGPPRVIAERGADRLCGGQRRARIGQLIEGGRASIEQALNADGRLLDLRQDRRDTVSAMNRRERRARDGELVFKGREAELRILSGGRQKTVGGLHRRFHLGKGGSMGGQLGVEDGILLTHDGSEREQLIRCRHRRTGLRE